MKRIVTFCALCALWGCKQADAPEMEGIALYYSTSEQSKTDLLAQGDEIGVFAAIEGTEDYFLDNTKYIVGTDGRSLSTTPAVYYPDRKEAVAFTAYLPFGGTWSGAVGTFAVPTDQSTATALKQADLCWAAASSTPVAAAVPLEFTHKMARLLVTIDTPTTTPTEMIVAPNAFSGGTLDMRTGTFTNTIKSTISTTGTELILPAQTINRLVLTVAGVEYVFDPNGPVVLQENKSNTLNLTLNPITQTATLAVPTVVLSNWNTSGSASEPKSKVSNAFTMHYAPAPADYAKADKITLTVKHPITAATQEIDLTPALVAGQSSASACGYTFALQLPLDSGIPYPYVVSRVRLYAGATVLRDTPEKYLKGSNVYRSGAQTLAHYITIKVRDELTNTTEIKNWAGVMGGGEQKLTKVTVEGADTWTAAATGAGVGTTASGANGAIGAIYWERNPSTAAGRSGSLTFATVPSGATLTIPTNQLAQATPPGTVLVNGVSICTGNLIADGPNGCKMGAPTDFGLNFQCGSLVGWSGGANGDGIGQGNPGLGVQVKPSAMREIPNFSLTQGPGVSILTNSCFNYSLPPWDNCPMYFDIGSFNLPMEGDAGSGNLRSGRYAHIGIGDPCTYYLGAAYRSPSADDILKLVNGMYPTISNSEGWTFGITGGGAEHLPSGVFLPGGGYHWRLNAGGHTAVCLVSTTPRSPYVNWGAYWTGGGSATFHGTWYEVHSQGVRCFAR